MENVKALTQKKFMSDFQKWIDTLNNLGYTSFWQVLNAKDYGVPQSRERVFMVSILDENASFNFPEPFELNKCILDILEDDNDVDEQFYLSDDNVKHILEHCKRKVSEGCGFKPQITDVGGISSTLLARYGQRETDTYIKTNSAD